MLPPGIKWGATKPPPGTPLDWSKPINVGLVGCWLFNENGGRLLGDVAKGNPGAFNNTPQWKPGEFGPAISFDGASAFLNAPDSPWLNFGSGNFTLAAWVKTTSVSRGSVITKMDFAAGGQQGYYLDVQSDGKIRTAFQTSGTQYRVRDSTIAVNTGSWVHLAVVRTSPTNFPDVYVNGVADNGATLTSGTTASVDNTVFLQVGRAFQTAVGSIQLFNGLIDVVQTWNRALLPIEARRLYTNPFAGFVDEDYAAWLAQSFNPAWARGANQMLSGGYAA